MTHQYYRFVECVFWFSFEYKENYMLVNVVCLCKLCLYYFID